LPSALSLSSVTAYFKGKLVRKTRGSYGGSNDEQ